MEEIKVTGVSDKIKSIVGFLTAGFEGKGDDIFDEIEQEMTADYPVDGNYALEPKFHPKSSVNKNSDSVHSSTAASNVVNHPSIRGYEVVVSEPRAYNDASQIVKHLKDRKTVLLNLHLLDKEQSVRVVDFLCGATHALCGNQQKIGDAVFIFTPQNVNLSSDSMPKPKIISDALWNQPL